MDNLLTAKETAKFLNCHPQSVYRNNALPYIDIPGIGKRYDPKDLKEYLDKNKHKYIPESPQVIDNQRFILTSTPDYGINKSNESGGSEMAKAKTKSRFNFGYGAIYTRTTKKGKIRWYLDYKDASGKRIQKVTPLATTKKEAEFALRDEIRKTFDHKYRISRTKTNTKFKDFAEDYLENYAKVNKKSWKCDNYCLNAHLVPYFGNYQLNEITPLLIEKYRAERMKSGIRKSSTNRELALLKKMFNLAIDWQYTKENPVQKVKLFSEKDNLKERVLSKEEEIRLLTECVEHLKPIVITALNTGMRRNEILSLTWNCVDLKLKIIHVVKTKSGKNREIPINNRLLAVLKEQKKLKKSDHVFPNPETNKPFRSIRHSFENACRRAKIHDLRFHDLRHTFACRMIQKGCDIETLRDLLGHHSISVTERYIHTNLDQKRSAVELLSEQKEAYLLRICDMDKGKSNKASSSSLFSVN